MIKNVRMNWETEMHTYTFYTGGDKIESLDFLTDIRGSLERLYEEIVRMDGHKEIPLEIKVIGGCGYSRTETK